MFLLQGFATLDNGRVVLRDAVSFSRVVDVEFYFALINVLERATFHDAGMSLVRRAISSAVLRWSQFSTHHLQSLPVQVRTRALRVHTQLCCFGRRWIGSCTSLTASWS